MWINSLNLNLTSKTPTQTRENHKNKNSVPLEMTQLYIFCFIGQQSSLWKMRSSAFQLFWRRFQKAKLQTWEDRYYYKKWLNGLKELNNKETGQTGHLFVSFNHNHFMHMGLITVVFVFLRENGFGRDTSTPWERLLSLLWES